MEWWPPLKGNYINYFAILATTSKLVNKQIRHFGIVYFSNKSLYKQLNNNTFLCHNPSSKKGTKQWPKPIGSLMWLIWHMKLDRLILLKWSSINSNSRSTRISLRYYCWQWQALKNYQAVLHGILVNVKVTKAAAHDLHCTYHMSYNTKTFTA